MSGQKILVLTAAHLCRNPRVVKEATALGAAGYEVTVLSVSSTERFERVDQELLRGLPFQRTTLDLTRGGTAQFMQRSTTWLARKLCQRFGIEAAQALGPASALLRRARALPAALTIAHNEIPLWAVQRLVRDGRRVAVDIEDWYSEDLLPADRRSRPLGLLRRAEAFALNHCAYASTTARSLADALVAAYRCPPPVVLRNSFPLQTHTRLDRPASDGPPSFIWFSQTVGPGRGLERFLTAWAQTKNSSRVCLLGDTRPAFQAELRALLPATRQADLQFLPLVAPAELPEKLAAFDIGLALEPSQPRNKDLTISNKVFQYLDAGLALLATGTAGQREVLAAAPQCGELVALDDADDLTHQLDALIANPARVRAMQTAARAAAEREFCWERESPRLLEAVARTLATPEA